jgi:hypothetical protein
MTSADLAQSSGESNETGRLETGRQSVALLFANPVAWFLLLLLVVATYQNYKLGGQLDTVCDAIEMPDDLPDKPSTALEKAQWICEDRLGAIGDQDGPFRRPKGGGDNFTGDMPPDPRDPAPLRLKSRNFH